MLTKIQAIQAIFAEYTSEENPLLWDYLASVVIKQVALNCSPEEKIEFKKLLLSKKDQEIDTFIEKRLEPVLPQIREEINTFTQKLQTKLQNIK